MDGSFSSPPMTRLATPLREGILEGCVLLGFDWTFLQVQPTSPELEAGALAPLVGRTWMDACPGVEATEAFACYRLGMEDRRPQRRESAVRKTDGRLAWFDLQVTPVPEGLLVLALGIPEPRRPEASSEDLRQELTNRSAQLEAAIHDLDTFAHSVAHDLRAPLRHIAGFAELLEAQDGPRLSEKGRGQLATIRRSAQLMDELMNQLRAYSQWGRVEPRLAAVDLRAMVDEVLTELAPQAVGRELRWEIAPLPQVRADPALLAQVFSHLLANALKFTRTRAQARIEIGFREEAKVWVIYIRDNGIGFNPQNGHRLFAIFQRLQANPLFEGIGMSLAHVRRIIQRHGGRTWAESDGQTWATFSFSLPRDPAS